MKYLSVLLLLIAYSCTNIVDPEIGGIYRLCYIPKELTSNNPFDDDNTYNTSSEATVLVIRKERGYVQYIWAHDSTHVSPLKFSRSISEFNDLMKGCK